MARNPKAPEQDSTPAVPDAGILPEGQQPEQPDTPPFEADIQHPKVTAEEAPDLEEGNPTLSDIGDLFLEPGEVVIPANLTEQLLSEKNGPKIAAAKDMETSGQVGPKSDKPVKAEKAPKQPKAEKAAKSPKEEKATEPPAPPEPEKPPEPIDATRPGEVEQIVYLNLSQLHAFKDHIGPDASGQGCWI